ncbi:hypothetical protein DS834_00530 [Lactobacillus bombicola]|uniref:Transposase n=1 Tax=Lactobacillus bombicola TaxID=1505723 RepID=A0ABX9LWC3_9LACO|nr:hypothetical protein DS834_00530 [Lactobacillus bombicola]
MERMFGNCETFPEIDLQTLVWPICLIIAIT